MGFFDIFSKKKKQDKQDPVKALFFELDLFTEISFSIPLKFRSDFLNDDQSHPIVFGYLLGAYDYLTKVYDITGEGQYVVLFSTYIYSNFTNEDAEAASHLVNSIIDLSSTEEGIKYMNIGANAYYNWVKNGRLAIVELAELLTDKKIV